MMFDKILIANRGEIACRVIRTAQRLGVTTVAVYSAADAGSRHVRLADEAIAIGAAPARESYLVGERIIAAALATGAQAIHPGYGFLSENEGFAQACADAGLVFIGPPVAAIRAMGGKSAAKRLMGEAGVPLTPGYHGEDQDSDHLFRQAVGIGWPVLIKASAGGGGKGMRLVEQADDFAAALESCRREAQASFGDDTMLIEKYITRPRHIEVQVFGDTHGNVVHLFERDCSVQRRHQKVLEEAPAPGMTPERRAAMGDAAVRAAQAVGYVGAGTVEFIANQDGSFYFMEMNTRLQVEHPVTEMITGLDLVEWQLRVAAGEPLPLLQHELQISGHSLEARIYAEDPERGFLPSTGSLHWLQTPAESNAVRIDTGIEAHDAITPFYDPMIAKLIVRGDDRAQALQQMLRALSQWQVVGVANNVGFLERLVGSKSFRDADLDTGLIEREREALFIAQTVSDARVFALAALHLICPGEQTNSSSHRSVPGDPFSPWQSEEGWRLGAAVARRFEFVTDDEVQVVTATLHASPWRERRTLRESGCPTLRADVQIGGHRIAAVAQRLGPHRVRATLDDHQIDATIFERAGMLWIFAPGIRARLTMHDPVANIEAGDTGGSGLVAPMPGRVIALLARPGATVRKGEVLLVMEAMKMEHSITAPADGVVTTMHFEAGDQVEEGAVLVAFATENEDSIT